MNVSSVSPYLNVMICDFNISISSGEGEDVKQYTGTPGYRSPEQVALFISDTSLEREALTDKTDSWSLGLVILELLTKCSLHDHIKGMTDSQCYDLLQSDQVDKIKAWSQWLSSVSTYDIPSIKDLYKGCLTVDRNDRWCMKTIYDKCRDIAVQGINRIEKHDHMTEAWTSNSQKCMFNM
jgi:serine/threonine protein kinase